MYNCTTSDKVVIKYHSVLRMFRVSLLPSTKHSPKWYATVKSEQIAFKLVAGLLEIGCNFFPFSDHGTEFK